jgi:hypothetical protein
MCPSNYAMQLDQTVGCDYSLHQGLFHTVIGQHKQIRAANTRLSKITY